MKFQIQIDEKEMYRFNLYHTYHSFNGVISVVIAAFVFVAAYVLRDRLEATDILLYIVLGMALLLYCPITLLTRSKMQLKMSPVLQHPLVYEFMEEGIYVSTEVVLSNEEAQQAGDTMEGSTNRALLKWSEVYKTVATKRQLLIYSNRVNAYVLPLSQIGDRYDELQEFIRAHT